MLRRLAARWRRRCQLWLPLPVHWQLRYSRNMAWARMLQVSLGWETALTSDYVALLHCNACMLGLSSGRTGQLCNEELTSQFMYRRCRYQHQPR